MFTSGIVSTGEGRNIALFFTGAKHAGENMADLLKQRAAELPAPIQMCDALSRNVPKLPVGVEILLANCLAHGRRQFVEVATNFPSECRYVLEMLGQVYGHDTEARSTVFDAGTAIATSSATQRTGDGQLQHWLEAQFAEKRRSRTRGSARRSLTCYGTGVH